MKSRRKRIYELYTYDKKGCLVHVCECHHELRILECLMDCGIERCSSFKVIIDDVVCFGDYESVYSFVSRRITRKTWRH